jgi:hypothetical protein
MSVPFSTYTNLNQYALLSGGSITSATSTVINASSINPANTTYYGTSSSPPTIIGPITGAGANPNNTLASAAQTNLAALVGALTTAFNASSTPFATGLSTNFNAGTNYTSTTAITLTSQTLTFNGAGQYIIYVTLPSGAITLTTCTFSFTGGANSSNTTIYWYSPNGITITGSSQSAPSSEFVPGYFIASGSNVATSAIDCTTTAITGGLYSLGAVRTTSTTINPLTLCYFKGTKILTPNGYTNVEDLQVGDHVLSYGSIANNEDVQLSETSEAKPIKWISSFYGVKRDASDLPICFKAGSLGENAPSSDLFVSPGHRVIIDGKMVVACDAVNGETIIQEDTLETIEYYHFELDEHSVVMAEGVLAETFLELDNFKNSFQS